MSPITKEGDIAQTGADMGTCKKCYKKNQCMEADEYGKCVEYKKEGKSQQRSHSLTLKCDPSRLPKPTLPETPVMTQKQKPKAGNRKKPKESEKEFTPPTDEEIIAYIKERQMDAKLGQPAETIAEAFRDVYEKEEETGEKDENGFSIRRIVWRKANGDMVQDWKGCLRTFKGRQLMWHGDASAVKESGRQKVSKPNQFCDFDQNQYTDDEITDLENDLLNSSGA